MALAAYVTQHCIGAKLIWLWHITSSLSSEKLDDLYVWPGCPNSWNVRSYKSEDTRLSLLSFTPGAEETGKHNDWQTYRQTDRQRMYIVTRRKRCYHKHRRRTAWLENRDINLNRISWVHVGRQYVPYFKGRSYHMNWNQRTYVSELSWPELRWRGFPWNYRILRFTENDKYDLNVHFQLIDSNEDRCLT